MLRVWWARKPLRIKFAAATLVLMSLAWPVSVVLMVLGYKIFEQTMIALSFIAPILTSIDILFTSQVKEDQDG